MVMVFFKLFLDALNKSSSLAVFEGFQLIKSAAVLPLWLREVVI